ncbi:MAG: hypothetical protein HOC05_19160 [Gemmatimonadetes bacterium]|jgi:hypothetical protein|nr:hypothetical protein [Gemmatimonadota bacterium]MBT4612173.1 hypothetical protein [Gemmatimonadota bacterium]MBT5142059.1 hypothetical protein [Gemmatimonadota bacterium]MBT5590160.1 hypothetical protein [Gemmatimonadota bacterium]MBT5961040.1 hypothetical protein [Gemmatimonadota bacterium]
MTTPEVTKLAIALLVPLAFVPFRLWIERGNEGPFGLFKVFGSAPLLAAITGAVLGWGAPDWVRTGLQPVPMLMFVFLAGWMGLVAGSSLDLRVSRKLGRAIVTRELGQAVVVLVAVAVLVSGADLILGEVTGFGQFHILTLASICLLGAILPQRQAQRGAGTASGFWDPSIIAPLALLMAAIAVVSDSNPAAILRLPAPSAEVLTLELGGALEQLLWATAAGAITGLLLDLVSREDFAPGGLYVQIAAVTLVSSGLAAMLGFSPLWIGAVAGFWSVSATLRRLDLLMVLERGLALPRVAAPALAGWCVGGALTTVGLNWPAVFVVSGVIIIVRPTVHTVVALAQRRHLLRRAGRRPRPIDPEIIELREIALVIAGAGGLILSARAFPSLLLGVLIAQLLLAISAQLWRDRGRSPAAES